MPLVASTSTRPSDCFMTAIRPVLQETSQDTHPIHAPGRHPYPPSKDSPTQPNEGEALPHQNRSMPTRARRGDMVHGTQSTRILADDSLPRTVQYGLWFMRLATLVQRDTPAPTASCRS